jgi:hypothetical protein
LASTSAAWKRIRGVVGQAGDPLGPKHRRELAKHAWQTPGRHDRHPAHDDLAPGDQGALDSHDWDDGRAWVRQDLGGLVGLKRHRAQCGSERIAALPQSPGWVELEPSSVLLGVDDQDAAGADDQVDAPVVVNPGQLCPLG